MASRSRPRPDKTAPVFEVSFTGLRGIFRYLLDETQRKTGKPFQHLDGEET